MTHQRPPLRPQPTAPGYTAGGAFRRAAFSFGAGVLLAASAAVALAHEDMVLDLDPIEQLVAQRVGETTGRDRTAYRRLQKALRTPSREKLTKDLAKLNAVLVCLGKLKAGDPALEGLLPGSCDDADAALAATPDVVEQQIDKVAKAKDRSRIEALALAAYDLHQDAKVLRATDVPGAIRGFAKASAKYDQALAAAAAAIRRQRGPLPQFKAAQAGHVYTVIGTGAGGFNGEGRAARRSSLYFVAEVKFGPDGRLYVLDWNNHCVRRLRADGTMERVCGSGTPGDSEGDPMTTAFNHPSSLAFDPQGRIYLAAWHNHKVKVYDPTIPAEQGGPKVYTIAGTVQGKGGDGGLATQAKFNLLPGIARYPNGDLLVTDAGNQVVRKILLSNPQADVNVAGVTVTTGTVTAYAGTQGVEGYAGDNGQATSAVLTFSKAQNAEPDGRMEMDAQGNVWITCSKGAVVRKVAADGTITTFAGTGVAGFSGDGGPASAAQLSAPSDVAISPDGTVYISDSGNNRVRRVAPDGTISTVAGGDAAAFAGDGDVAANARFSRPDGLELDAHGNLWICDRYNSRVRVIAAADATLAAASPARLEVPVDPYKLPLPAHGAPPTTGASGTIHTIAGTPGTFGFNGDGLQALDTQLYWPQDVATDPQFGLVHVLDWNNHRVRRIEADGTVTTIVGTGELGDTQGPARQVRMNHPTDLVFHPVTGELWIAGWHTDKVIRVASGESVVYMAGKTRTFSGDGGPPSLAELNLPSSVKFDAAGNWYVADEGNRRIRFVDAAADRISTICGDGTAGTPLTLGDNGPAALAKLNFPIGQAAQPGGRICLSPDERYLYVADTNNHRIRRIDLQDPQRTIVTVAGNGDPGFTGDGGQATAATLRNPTDVDCDAQGNLYIADGDNSAIRKVDIASGVITSLAGNGTPGFAGDGGPAAAAKLNYPSGLFVQRSTGRVYVADTYNGVVRVIWE